MKQRVRESECRYDKNGENRGRSARQILPLGQLVTVLNYLRTAIAEQNQFGADVEYVLVNVIGDNDAFSGGLFADECI